jgi:hypothetical protein
MKRSITIALCCAGMAACAHSAREVAQDAQEPSAATVEASRVMPPYEASTGTVSSKVDAHGCLWGEVIVNGKVEIWPVFGWDQKQVCKQW